MGVSSFPHSPLLPHRPPRHGGAYKCLKILLRHKLVHHDGTKYDGYRLTNMGYDFLAIKVGGRRRGGAALRSRPIPMYTQLYRPM